MKTSQVSETYEVFTVLYAIGQYLRCVPGLVFPVPEWLKTPGRRTSVNRITSRWGQSWCGRDNAHQ